MKRIVIENSSNIKSVGYDQFTEKMEIEFHTGKVYQYFPIDPYTYRDFLKAESKGNFFAKNIRNNPAISTIQITGK